MRKRKFLSRVSAAVLTVALAVSAFTVTVAAEEIHPGLQALDELLTDFPRVIKNDDEILKPGDEGNTLRWCNASNNSFPGLFQDGLSSEAMDAEIMAFQNGPFIWWDASFMWCDGGIANLAFDLENNAVIITMQEEVYWHDGEQLTLDDLVFAYELLAHRDYTGIRYVESSYIPWVIGVNEYRDGEAETIEGLVLSEDEMTLTINYDRPLPPAAQYAGGIWAAPIPRHHLEPAIEEVGVGKLNEHARARHEALGYGPWIIESVVPGQSVLFKANDNYYRGRPNIDYLLWEVVPTDLFMAAMREGLYDYAALPTINYEEYTMHNANNMQVLAWPSTSNGYMYFRTGTMEPNENGDLIATPREEGWHPIQDVNIRRALCYAMPQQLIAETINNGLAVPAGTIMNPHNAREFISADIPSFDFDLDKANEVLDDAGYTKRGADGYRLDLNGDPMFFTFAANLNDFNKEAVPVYLEMWREIGLDVRLHQGDLIEWNTFLDNVLLTDNWSDEVHMFISNWSMGANPAPHGLWSVDNTFNMPRHNTEEFVGILADIASQDAFDREFLTDAYYRWQMYMFDHAVANQMFWSIALFQVNNRVSGFSLIREPGLNGATQRSHTWGLTATEPYKNTK